MPVHALDTASTISLTRDAPTPPPSPDLSPLRQRIGSLRKTIGKWFTAVSQCLQSIMQRIQAVRRRSWDTEATSVAVQEDTDVLSLVTQVARSDVIAIGPSTRALSSEVSEPDSDARSVMGERVERRSSLISTRATI